MRWLCVGAGSRDAQPGRGGDPEAEGEGEAEARPLGPGGVAWSGAWRMSKSCEVVQGQEGWQLEEGRKAAEFHEARNVRIVREGVDWAELGLA
jgi:hypothetical protein